MRAISSLPAERREAWDYSEKRERILAAEREKRLLLEYLRERKRRIDEMHDVAVSEVVEMLLDDLGGEIALPVA